MQYFFDVSGAGVTTCDSEGLDLETREDAADEAARILAEVALHHLSGFPGPAVTFSIAVREGGKAVFNSRLVIETQESE